MGGRGDLLPSGWPMCGTVTTRCSGLCLPTAVGGLPLLPAPAAPASATAYATACAAPETTLELLHPCAVVPQWVQAN